MLDNFQNLMLELTRSLKCPKILTTFGMESCKTQVLASPPSPSSTTGHSKQGLSDPDLQSSQSWTDSSTVSGGHSKPITIDDSAESDDDSLDGITRPKNPVGKSLMQLASAAATIAAPSFPEFQLLAGNPVAGNAETVQGKAWVLTINNPVEDWDILFKHYATEMIEEKKWVYVAWAHEVAPTTTTPHIHIALLCKNCVRRVSISKIPLFKKAWIDPKSVNSSWSQTVDYFKYVKAEGVHHTTLNKSFKEMGDFPTPEVAHSSGVKKGGVKAGEIHASKWSETLAFCKAGTPYEANPQMIIMYHKTLISLTQQFHKISDLSVLSNLWIVGPTGTGKSKWAREHHTSYYSKPQSTTWWDGYMYEPNVIIDDVDQQCKAADLKIWADHYAFNAQVKGASLNIRPARIIVTSNQTIRQLYPSEHDYLPLERRFRLCQVKNGFLLDYSEKGTPPIFLAPIE